MCVWMRDQAVCADNGRRQTCERLSLKTILTCVGNWLMC
jgi:hypothetical protein